VEPSPVVELNFTLNGAATHDVVAVGQTACEYLRDACRLTSVHNACDGLGMCGACTILVDGRAACSCLLLVLELDGTTVETAEGLADGTRLHPLQQAFVELGALQCGYCTPAMLLAAKALLAEQPHPTRAEIVHALTGNLCRCTGYAKIVDAIASVAKAS
jgi:aerobic-type carbon monoxide dehydrogenase small subunit (CoxS/CutS family)